MGCSSKRRTVSFCVLCAQKRYPSNLPFPLVFNEKTRLFSYSSAFFEFARKRYQMTSLFLLRSRSTEVTHMTLGQNRLSSMKTSLCHINSGHKYVTNLVSLKVKEYQCFCAPSRSGASMKTSFLSMIFNNPRLSKRKLV